MCIINTAKSLGLEWIPRLHGDKLFSRSWVDGNSSVKVALGGSHPHSNTNALQIPLIRKSRPWHLRRQLTCIISSAPIPITWAPMILSSALHTNFMEVLGFFSFDKAKNMLVNVDLYTLKEASEALQQRRIVYSIPNVFFAQACHSFLFRQPYGANGWMREHDGGNVIIAHVSISGTAEQTVS